MQLGNIRSVLVIDWPSREVPETLARRGFDVVVRGGPRPEDFSAFDCSGSEITVRKIGRPPERADLVYAFRPLSELPGIIALAKDLQAHTIWTQSGASSAGRKDPRGCWLPENDASAARKLVESAGLTYIDQPYILDALGTNQSPGL